MTDPQYRKQVAENAIDAIKCAMNSLQRQLHYWQEIYLNAVDALRAESPQPSCESQGDPEPISNGSITESLHCVKCERDGCDPDTFDRVHHVCDACARRIGAK
jgi:hypothetical protein